ncbi:unnamed protein product [Spirodela intermedia]|uniref:Uncharacterized protein n=1 Tax=Spirodela intermedia TaxID=51605 RepID=A0A7I8LCV8_SPIIN|nr:unnamed protein product [Spirodela intermedia]
MTVTHERMLVIKERRKIEDEGEKMVCKLRRERRRKKKKKKKTTDETEKRKIEDKEGEKDQE